MIKFGKIKEENEEVTKRKEYFEKLMLDVKYIIEKSNYEFDINKFSSMKNDKLEIKNPIFDYINLLINVIQNKITSELLEKTYIYKIDMLDEFGIIINSDYSYRHMASTSLQVNPTCNMSKDTAVFSIWNRKGLLNKFFTLGFCRNNTYEQDCNLMSYYISPVNLFIVHNGNHSAFVSKERSEGQFTANETFDFRPLYSEISFDGDCYRNNNQEVLYRPKYVEAGAIFEIGRELGALTYLRSFEYLNAENEILWEDEFLIIKKIKSPMSGNIKESWECDNESKFLYVIKGDSTVIFENDKMQVKGGKNYIFEKNIKYAFTFMSDDFEAISVLKKT